MKKMLTAAAAMATIAVVLAGTATSAEAYWRRGWGWGPGVAAGLVGGAIVGGAIASSRYYGPVAGPGCYWARVPVYDGYGNVIGWSGRPRMVCP